MIAFTAVGSVILAFFLWLSSKVGSTEDEQSVPGSLVAGIVLMIALSGFLIAAGLFS